MATQPSYARVLSGPQSIREAENIAREKLKEKQAAWPYVWFAAPPGSQHVRAAADIVAPPNGVLTLVLAYQVPNGQNFCLTHVLLNADVGNAWTPGDGSVIFRIDVNTPGGGNAQGIPFKDFENVQVPLGSFANGPWPVIATEQAIFEGLETIRVKVLTPAVPSGNGSPITPGAPNFIHAMLIGYTWPD
jgi:hypothetical protein